MKKLILLLFVSIAFINCTEEQVEQIQENFIVNAMTSGQWTVKNFTVNGTSKTADFANFKFQFKKDNTVDAILISNNSVSSTGSWAGSITPSPNITSTFPSNAGATLLLLNGNWSITNSGTTYVEATQSANGELKTMRLEKL